MTWSRMVHVGLEAAEVLSGEGIEVEIVDLRTISPLDETAVLESVRATGRLAVLHEAVESGGFGAEVAARVAAAGFWHLDAPVRRIAPPFTPVPYTPELEAEWLPDVGRVVAEIRDLVRS